MWIRDMYTMFHILFHSQSISKHPSYLSLLAGYQCQGGVSRRSSLHFTPFSSFQSHFRECQFANRITYARRKYPGSVSVIERDSLGEEKRGKSGHEARQNSCERISEEKRTHGGVCEPRGTLLITRNNCAD